MSLRDMKEIRLGQTTDVFRKDPRPDLVQSSFSLIFPDRRSPSPQPSFRTEFTLLNFLISPSASISSPPTPRSATRGSSVCSKCTKCWLGHTPVSNSTIFSLQARAIPTLQSLRLPPLPVTCQVEVVIVR